MDKATLVNQIFDSIASNYNLMNDIMSIGLHRIWKDSIVNNMHINSGMKILDVAGGTGDVAIKIATKEPTIKIVVCDISQKMLDYGYNRAINLNHLNIEWILADVSHLPFQNDTFDYCTLAFGVRNFADRKRALSEIYRVLKPMGQFICLEFNSIQQKNKIFKKFYDFYSLKVIPEIGQMITDNRVAYEYLVRSIRAFPVQEEFQEEIKNAGFIDTTYTNLSCDIVAIYKSIKK